ncbi:MAG: efflux RND transporter periplasmic adaptor subunit [Planctomyces sp.]|nr:efflux RND transporter periplasmic adaptor subunit [Planctomyces sp.]
MKLATNLLVATAFGGALLSTAYIPKGSPTAPLEPVPSLTGSATPPRTTLDPADCVFAAGLVEGAERESLLQFEVEGRIVEILVREGAAVVAGDPLARLEDTTAKSLLSEAQGKLALAKAEYLRLVNGAREETLQVARAEAEVAANRLAHADSGWTRAQRLAKENAITKEQLDTYRFGHRHAEAEYELAKSRVAELEAAARTDDLKIAEAKVEIAAAAVAQAEDMLRKSVLRAPLDGMVLTVSAEPGELVGPGRGQPLFSIANLSRLHVRAYVEELDVLELEVGQKAAVVADARPNQEYGGCVVWIAPSMQEKRLRHHKPGERSDVRVREVLVQLDEGSDLVVGLPVDVFIMRGGEAAEEGTSGLSMSWWETEELTAPTQIQ